MIFAGWTFQVCSTPLLFALCNGFTTRHFHIFLMMKLLYLVTKKGPRALWSMMLKVLNWPLIMSPSDHFIAAVVLVVRFSFLFYFLFYFLAQVATKNRILVLFYRVLNSICYLWVFLMVLRKPKLLLCVVDIDQFFSLRHQETTIIQCIIAVYMSIWICPLIPNRHVEVLLNRRGCRRQQVSILLFFNWPWLV